MPLKPSKYYIQKIKNFCWHLPKSIFFNLINGFPSRKLVLIGITGTDGKTTTATLIRQLLDDAGFKADSITTINSPGLHTTSPDPSKLQSIFKQMVKNGTTHVVVETTAHGLDQFRFFGCRFDISILTNISHEHLDDFFDIENYTKAKSKLFKHSKISVLNADDSSFSTLKNIISTKIITYGIDKNADIQAKKIKLTDIEMSFFVNKTKIVTDSLYKYQIYNILAALAISQHFNIPEAIFLHTVKYFPEVKGRRQEIANNAGIKTIVDFAHTPQALKQTLESLKMVTKNRLIVIFGATGGRDKTKRPIMGQVVSENSDIAIITSDDTRMEPIDQINQNIISGINQKMVDDGKFTYYVEPDRQSAFNMAINMSKPGDTIIACGKGHETSILIGKTEYPWSEADAFRTAIRLKNESKF